MAKPDNRSCSEGKPPVRVLCTGLAGGGGGALAIFPRECHGFMAGGAVHSCHGSCCHAPSCHLPCTVLVALDTYLVSRA